MNTERDDLAASGQCRPARRERPPLLTAEQERKLAARIKAGDKAARERMILANMGLVVKLAQGYARDSDLLDDLIQEGTWGLIRAVDRFDPQSHHTRFSTYATIWIRKGILLALKANGPIIPLSRYAPPPSFRCIFLSEPIESSDCCADQQLQRAEDLDDLERAIGRLSTIESLVIRWRFGLDGTNVPLKIAGRILGVPVRRVCEIECAALSNLRQILGPESLD